MRLVRLETHIALLAAAQAGFGAAVSLMKTGSVRGR